MTYILLAIFIWFVYYFVTKFVLPIYLTTKKVKEQFRNIREQQAAYQKQQQRQQAPPQQPEQKEKVGEYIEFEEVTSKGSATGFQ